MKYLRNIWKGPCNMFNIPKGKYKLHTQYSHENKDKLLDPRKTLHGSMI